MKNFVLFVLIQVFIISVSGCVTEDVDDKYGYNYEVSENSKSMSDKNVYPSQYTQVRKFISGDSILVMTDTSKPKIIKFAGIECPKEGEPYFQKAKDFNQWIIRSNIIMVVWVEDTKKSDDIWFANIITKVPTVPQVSVIEQLVKNGFAKITTNSPIKYERLDNNGKIYKLTKDQNFSIFNRLVNLQKEAKSNKLNIWSGKYEE